MGNLLAMAGTALLPMLVCRMVLMCTSVGSPGDIPAHYTKSHIVSLRRPVCCLI